jgi:iron-sulfur cluster repair protein YtfE (RIC family)
MLAIYKEDPPMTSLPRVAHEHHDRLLQHLDEMPSVGRAILSAPIDDLRPKLRELDEWLNGLLIPHMEAAERSLYPELERMMQNRHSMAPMRREHAEIRRLVAELSGLIKGVADKRPSMGQQVALRRVLYRLYALLEIHVAEEEMFLPLITHGVSDEAADAMAAALEHAGISEG